MRTYNYDPRFFINKVLDKKCVTGKIRKELEEDFVEGSRRLKFQFWTSDYAIRYKILSNDKELEFNSLSGIEKDCFWSCFEEYKKDLSAATEKVN